MLPECHLCPGRGAVPTFKKITTVPCGGSGSDEKAASTECKAQSPPELPSAVGAAQQLGGPVAE